MTLAIRPLTPLIGAEVTGIDLRQPVDDATRRALVDAWITHAVLVIRAQSLEPAAFNAAATIFGEPMAQQLRKYALPDQPTVGFISNRDLPRRADGKQPVRGEQYHTDHSNHVEPPKATLLHAVTLPDRGGDTQFVDARAAYDDLDDATKRQIAGLRSRHTYESSRSPRPLTPVSDAERAAMETTSHPLVIRHPVSGRAALFLNTARMEGVEGMAPDDGFALIARLFAHATQPKYEYRHRWQSGDLVIWDNRSVLHQANADFDMSQLRYLYRIMLKGERPLAA